MPFVSKWESIKNLIGKYNSGLSFGVLLLGLAIMALNFSQINWVWFYLSYAVLYLFGIEIGYHRALCHGVRYFKQFETFCLGLGLLTHIGGYREAVLYHLHHHAHADTDSDHKKTFLTAISPTPGEIRWNRSRYADPFNRIKGNFVLNFVDHNYYTSYFAIYLVLWTILGLENTANYVFAPAAMSLLVHRYAAYFFHTFGYRNFNLGDNSRNVFWLLPLVFGENWHNNHHRAPRNATTRHKWWEVDPAFILSRPFLEERK